MSEDSNKISKLWRNEYSSHISKYSKYRITEEFEKVASLFAPGESYFYILNMHNLELDYISSGLKTFFGISSQKVTINQLLNSALPEEIEIIEQKEKVIKDFLSRYLEPNEIVNYKLIYSYEMRDYKNKKRIMLLQATPVSISENNMPMHVLSIHCDISHLATCSTRKVSFVNINGGKSYYNVPIEKGLFSLALGNPEPDISTSLTNREKEIIDLLAKGYGAKQVAQILNLSIHTVQTHRKNILAKSGCRNTAELIAESMIAGIVA